MSAISQSIPNLLGGVSQQPDPVKLPGQVREAENVYLDPTFGCKKRPPTKFIAKLADDIPDGAKWFPIFRDNDERYIVCIYKDSSNQAVLKVWNADTGAAETVSIATGSGDYLLVDEIKNLQHLTINDYTLISNAEKKTTISANSADPTLKEAVVVINQVAYNTTYQVDFIRDGSSVQQTKVYRASRLTISPGSFEDTTDGNCGAASSQNYVVNHASDVTKTGLGFNIEANCTPTLVTTNIAGEVYPTAVVDATAGWAGGAVSWGLQGWATYNIGSADNYAAGSYVYKSYTANKPAGDITIRVELRIESFPAGHPYVGHNKFAFSNATITNYTISGNHNWSTNAHAASYTTLSSDLARWAGGPIYTAGSSVGFRVKVSNVSTGPSSDSYSYKSSYYVRVTLNNGGSNWRVGDSVTATLSGKSYTIKVEGETFGFAYASENQASYTTPATTADGTLDVGSIAADLATDIQGFGTYNSGNLYDATPIGNVIYIKRNDGRDFNIQTKGGTADNALYGIKGTVNDISQLPKQCEPGLVLLVRNSVDSESDDYYVKFVPSSADIPGQGAWEETTKPGIDTDLNPSTMPHALIREDDGDFVFRPLSKEYSESLFWAPREVGDLDTNPDPSFLGKPIQGLFFYMNRLGFLSEDTVILSQPGDFFNFFQTSAIAVSDSDPIDMGISTTKPAILKYALGTPKGLLLFADNSQFLLATSEAAFGPSTVKISEISSYAYTSNVPPIETGVSIMFTTEASTYSKVLEMAVDSIDNRPLVAENTRIIPEYIPPKLKLSATNPNNSFVVFGDGTENLYTFKFFNVGNERSVAGWAKWVMPAPVELFDFVHDTGYCVLSNKPEATVAIPNPQAVHVLTKLEMLDDPKTSPITALGMKYVPRLDNYLHKTDTTVVSNGDTTSKIRLPEGSYVVGNQLTAIVTLNGIETFFSTKDVEEDATGFYATYPDELTGQADFIIGLPYVMKVALPSIYVVVEKKADRNNVPIVENVYLDLYMSGRYQATVERTGYTSRTIDLDVTPADIYSANEASMVETESIQVPVFCRGDYVKITVSADSPLPSVLTSYSWEGHYANRGIKLIR